MRYLGWVTALIIILIFYYQYNFNYLPLRKRVIKLEDEIKMWEQTLRDQKEITGDKNRFSPEKFFIDDKLTPYGEVEILRSFDRSYKGIEIYISAPNALKRAADLMRFMHEQRIDYQNSYLFVVVDSIERFEYKFIK
uniref:Uncharacterized protein n=1 Tax=candidate division WOR-3 bacterium TaxID=2052148 RepID=A0A7C4XJT7_UNCW3